MRAGPTSTGSTSAGSTSAGPTSAGSTSAIAAGVLAVAVAVAAAALHVADLAAGPVVPPSPTDFLPLLIAAAGLCAAGLLRHRAPAIGWLITVIATAIAALEVVGVIRGWQQSADATRWPLLVVVAELTLVAAVGVAGVYAVRARGPRPGTAVFRTWQLLVLVGVVAMVLAASWAVALYAGGGLSPAVAEATTNPFPPLRVTGRLGVGFITIAAVVGGWLDLAPAVARARARSASLRDLPGALGDELLPNAAAMRRRGVESERARLAADLHALVLPDLRRAAAAAAEAPGSASDPVAAGLRQAVEDVEQLINARQSIVLEEYGLVAALEWLAERTQQRSSIRVELDLEGEAIDDPTAIPRNIARAAFRVALLAVDNAIRHASASRIDLRLSVDRGGIRLAITDDGVGFEPAAGRGAAGRQGRGLVDMRAEAAEIGAALRIDRPERGTRIELAWVRAKRPVEDHASGPQPLTSSQGAPPD